MVVVADSSPLIYLAALSDFALLHELFDEILVPSAVWREVVDQGEGFRVQGAAREAAAAGWLQVAPLTSQAEPIRHGSHELHSGETEVIRLSQQMRADILLIDDRSAVAYARALGFRVSPTIAIYIEAKRKGLVASVRDRVDALRAAGFHLTSATTVRCWMSPASCRIGVAHLSVAKLHPSGGLPKRIDVTPCSNVVSCSISYGPNN